MPESIRAFAVSLRGHGDLGRPERGYGPRDFAGDTILSTLSGTLDAGFVHEFHRSTLAKPVPEPFFETIARESLAA